LPQHGIYERSLAVVNMGNDGDIPYRLGHRGDFPSFGLANRAMVGARQEGELPHSAALSILPAGGIGDAGAGKITARREVYDCWRTNYYAGSSRALRWCGKSRGDAFGRKFK
jgi:hypothetical protein